MNKLSIKLFAKFALCGLAAVMLASPLKISAEEVQSLSGNTPGEVVDESKKLALDSLYISFDGKTPEDDVWHLTYGMGMYMGVYSKTDSEMVNKRFFDYYTIEWTSSDNATVSKAQDNFSAMFKGTKIGEGTVSVKITDKKDASKTITLVVKTMIEKGQTHLTNTTDAVKTEDLLALINSGISNQLFLSVSPETTAIIAADVFKAAKEAGVDLIIQSSVKGQNVVFTFKAEDITHTDIDLDLSVLVDAKNDAVTSIIPSEAAPLIVDFAHNGNLPGKANVTITILNEEMYNTYKDSKELNVYHINKATGNLEKIDNATVDGATINFTITHCSQYVLTKTELVEGQTKFADVKKDELDAQPNTGV